MKRLMKSKPTLSAFNAACSGAEAYNHRHLRKIFMPDFFSRSVSKADYSVEQGECPFDQGKVEYLKFKDQDVDIGLLASSFPFGVRVCSRCLVASSESDFLTGVHLSGSDSITGILNSRHNSLAHDLAAWLPMRLEMAMSFLGSLSQAEYESLVDLRKHLIEENLLSFLRSFFHGLHGGNAATLVKHLTQMMFARLDPIELIGRLMSNYRMPAEFREYEPATKMIEAGADPSVTMALRLYGSLVAGLDSSAMNALEPGGGLSQELAAKLILFHLDLERLVIFMAYVNGKPRVRAKLREQGLFAGATGFMNAVEAHIQSEHTAEQAGRAQHGYHYLNMGRSHYKSGCLCLELMRHAPSVMPDIQARALHHLDRAWAYLELSLIAERYPEFEPQERPQSLAQKGRVKVPFFFGEFGVRLLLCRVYNELGYLAKAGALTTKSADTLANDLGSHWLKMHGKFREVEFGGFDDPKAAVMLIPRMMAMPDYCFHPKAAEAMRKLIAANQERLYSRYNKEAAEFFAAHPPPAR